MTTALGLVFTNGDSDTFTIDETIYKLGKDWDGFGVSFPDVQSDKSPFQDGENFIDVLDEPRLITLPIIVRASDRQTLMDRNLALLQAFNPKLGVGFLTFTQPDGTTIYQIDVAVQSIVPLIGNGRSHVHQIIMVQLKALNPYWYDPSENQEEMAFFIDGLTLPFTIPFNLGELGSIKDITNAGNVDTPVEITFAGALTNPIILANNTTGKSLTVNKDIALGETLNINTKFGAKAVTITSGGVTTDAWEFVTPASKFWTLQPGVNELEYTVAAQGETAQALVNWFDRFSGV